MASLFGITDEASAIYFSLVAIPFEALGFFFSRGCWANAKVSYGDGPADTENVR